MAVTAERERERERGRERGGGEGGGGTVKRTRVEKHRAIKREAETGAQEKSK